MSVNLVQLLADLVSLPSVNPMGRDITGDHLLEFRVTEYLEKFFRGLGVPYVRQTMAPLRDNIVARLDGDSDQVVMLEAHQDTVPVDGMTIEPFKPEIRNGRIYGRGSCDIKGGMAAMLTAFARLAAERPAGRPTVIMACSVNEEAGFTGISKLSELWTLGQPTIIPRTPDAAIIAEPTLLNVVVAHKGAIRWKCHTHGLAAHSSQPQLGDNAIYKMSRVVQAIERYYREVVPTLPVHPLCGRPTVCASMISGGISANTVPDRCTIEIDRRAIPTEDAEAAYQAIVDYTLEHAGTEGIEHERPYSMARGLSDNDNGPLADRLLRAARELNPESEKVGVPYGTDAGVVSQTIPSVVFGPGSIDQAHTCDEWLAIDQLERASEIYYRFARNCG